jgi:hypothetical protein
MSDLQSYFLAQAKTEAARYQREAAAFRLELCKIRERLAEIKSQHEPLDSWSDGDSVIRNSIYNAAFYVVVGRVEDE